MTRWITAFLLSLASLPSLAAECLPPVPGTMPVLVVDEVRINVSGVSEEELQVALRERLTKGGKYRIALPDQYRYALQNKRIDRCTPAYSVQVQVGVEKSDPGASFGFGGFVTRYEFSVRTTVSLLPDGVTMDSFVLEDKGDSVVSGKKVAEAFERVFEKVAMEIESRRDRWISSSVPGF